MFHNYGLRLVLVMCTVVVTSLAAFSGLAAEYEPFKVQVVQDDIVIQDIFGFGWNLDPLIAPGIDNVKEWDVFTELLDRAYPGWIRLLGGYVYQARPGAPYIWNKPGGHETMKYIYRFLDYAQSRDIYVYYEFGSLAPLWMSDTGTAGGYPRNVDDYGKYIADVLYHLRVEKGYDVIQGVSIWNEPPSPISQDDSLRSAKQNFPDSFIPLYRTVHEHLVELGIRDEIDIVGLSGFWDWRASGAPVDSPEYFVGTDPHVIRKIVEQADEYLDIISIHDYWARFDYESGSTITTRLLKGLAPAALGQIRDADTNGTYQSVVIGELGSPHSGNEFVPVENTDSALFVAEASLRLFKAGIRGTQKWAWNVHPAHQAISVAGTWTAIPPTNGTHLVKYTYYPLSLFSFAIPRGSDVLVTSSTGGTDMEGRGGTRRGTRRVFAGAFRWDDGFSLVVVNNDFIEWSIEVDLGKEFALNKYYVSDSRVDDGIKAQGVRIARAISDTVEPRSVTVYTTRVYQER